MTDFIQFLTSDPLTAIVLFWLVATANVFVINGAFIAANHIDDNGRGMILAPLNRALTRAFGSYWSKPFFGCYKCMGSMWGGVPLAAGLYVALYGLIPVGWYMTLPLAFGALYAALLAFYATFLYNLMDKAGRNEIKQLVEYMEADDERQRMEKDHEQRRTKIKSIIESIFGVEGCGICGELSGLSEEKARTDVPPLTEDEEEAYKVDMEESYPEHEFSGYKFLTEGNVVTVTLTAKHKKGGEAKEYERTLDLLKFREYLKKMNAPT